MNAGELRQLIEGGETFTVEFKRASVSDNDLVETVVCLANGDGGTLLVGVDDDGTVVGISSTRSTSSPGQLAAMIAAKTQPSVSCSVEFIELEERKRVAVVTVPRSDTVVATTTGLYKRRAQGVDGSPTCMPMAPHEVISRVTSVGPHDFTATVLSALAPEDLSAAEFERMRSLAAKGGDQTLALLSDEDILKALQLITPSGELTIGAALLFGTENAIERFVPTHEVAFQVLDRLEVRSNYIGCAPLLRAMEETATRIDANNPEDEVQIGLLRLGLPRFSDKAVREILANALVHRDYTRLGPVRVQIDEDALEVSSPGGFPRGINIHNLLVASPVPRNPLLADAFKRANLVERTGRGINRAFEGQLALGHPAPDYGRSTEDQVVARLRSGPSDREFAIYVAELERDGQGLSLRELLALHEVRSESQITASRAGGLMQVSADEARVVLNGLVERGLLEARGAGKARAYHLSAALYKRLGDPSAYVRVRGFDAFQHEQMILKYVEKHGSITRAHAAELCQLQPDQAGRLLRRMRDEDKLRLVGERRGAHYVLP